ncbi:CBS domain-containing protein [Candidatus Nitrososphaera sp. FF02]|uniref:CBS domain-containing protein n=1 Tax=Candidatus Nitrososphaera sp. FF02 TaxID=3398226 RepID=UPI0039E79228
MSKDIAVIELDLNPSALNVAKAMSKSKVGAVIVLKGGKPVGMITERDLLKKVSAKNKKPDDVSAKSIMSSPLVTIKAFDSVDTAAKVMSKHGIKRLPVVEDDGSLAGMLSVSDFAKKLAKILTDDYNRYRSLKATLDL